MLAQEFDLLTKAVPKGASAYAKALRDATRALWTGRFDTAQFNDAMFSAVSRNFELAWRTGASQCGISPSERTPEETERLNELIDQQMEYVPDLAQFIAENSRENGVLLRRSLNRLPVWANRWNETKAIAQQMACSDQKLVWRIGKTEKHCRTCLKLNGRIMRASKWKELDIWPQDTRKGKLACNGYNCDCSLNPTNKRATPGPLPRL
jgi:hypothetical protein